MKTGSFLGDSIRLLIGIPFVFAALTVQAATYCVGPSATGNGSGSDWNNQLAWSSTPARGDTWYLFGTNYSSKTFSTANSGTTYITIKKAIAGDNVTSTGWSNWMTNQTVFGGTITFWSSYWTFDGQVDGGLPIVTNGCGFKITANSNAGIQIGDGSTHFGSFITLKHFEVVGEGVVDSLNFAVSIEGNGTTQCGDISIYNASLHESGCTLFASDWGYGNYILDHCYFGRYYGSSAVHAEVAKEFSSALTNVVVRYCLVNHIELTGGFMWDNLNGFYFYGNTIYRADNDNTWVGGANGILGSLGSGVYLPISAINWTIVNNTWINTPFTPVQLFNAAPGNPQVNLTNNIFYHANAYLGAGSWSQDYDYYNACTNAPTETHGQVATGNPFNNYSALNFTLVGNTAAGFKAGSQYGTDPNGVSRATWTRGAYEYGSTLGSGSPAMQLRFLFGNPLNPSASYSFGSARTNSATTNTLITVQNLGTGTLNGTGSVAAPFFIVSGSTYSLTQNQSQPVTVCFKPTAISNYSRTFTLSGSGGVVTNLTLSGEGTAATTPTSPQMVIVAPGP